MLKSSSEKNTINTIPPVTMNAYRDHGHPKERIELDLEQAEWVMDVLPELNIDIDAVTQQLEDEGVNKFNKQFDKIMTIIDNTTVQQKKAG